MAKISLKKSEPTPLPNVVSQLGRSKPEIGWYKAEDGGQLGYRFWLGEAAKPVALYLHGIEGHSQWFENTANVLNQVGMNIYALDRRGSGMNRNDRGHLISSKNFLSDIELFLQKIASDHPTSPIFLLGGCWSARAAAILTSDGYRSINEDKLPPISGLVLICPAIYSKVDMKLTTKLQIAWELFAGRKNDLHYWDLPLQSTMYTDEPEYLDFIDKDPLRLTKVTTSFLIETLLLAWRGQVAAKSLSLPVLVIQSGEDQIVDTKKVEDWYQQILSKDKTLKTFAGAYHSIDFDRTHFSDYTTLLSKWILARSKS